MKMDKKLSASRGFAPLTPPGALLMDLAGDSDSRPPL